MIRLPQIMTKSDNPIINFKYSHMKLVLKYGTTIKLYNQTLDYQTLLSFIQREMMLDKESIGLNFTDEEGDQIVIGCDEDLSVMENLAGDKTYIKINVSGKEVKVQKSQESIVRDLSQTKVQTSSNKVESQPKKEEQEKKEADKLQKQAEEAKRAQEKAEKQRKAEAQKLEKEKQKALEKQEIEKKKAELDEERKKKKAAQQEEKQKQKAAMIKQREIKQAAQKEQKEKERALLQEKKEEERQKKLAAQQEEKKKRAEEEKQKKAEQKKLALQAKEKQTKMSQSEGQAQKKKPVNNNFATFNKLMSDTIVTMVNETVRSMVPYLKEEMLMVRSDKVEELEGKLVHENFSCSICKIHPIVGIRYECPKCEGFSLCEKCEELYDHDHNLMKIKKLEEKKVQKKAQPSIRKLYDNFFAPHLEVSKMEAKNEVQQSPQNLERFQKYGNLMKQLFGGKIVDFKPLITENNVNMFKLVGLYCAKNNMSHEEGEKKYVDFLSTKLATDFKKEAEEMKSFVIENVNTDYQELKKMLNKKNKEEEKAKKEQEKKAAQEEKKVEEKVQEMVEQKVEKIEKVEEKAEEVCPGSHLTGEKKEIFTLMVEFFGRDKAAEYPSFIEEHFKEGQDKMLELWSNNISVYQC